MFVVRRICCAGRRVCHVANLSEWQRGSRCFRTKLWRFRFDSRTKRTPDPLRNNRLNRHCKLSKSKLQDTIDQCSHANCSLPFTNKKFQICRIGFSTDGFLSRPAKSCFQSRVSWFAVAPVAVSTPNVSIGAFSIVDKTVVHGLRRLSIG
jgi:hypothetical protein